MGRGRKGRIKGRKEVGEREKEERRTKEKSK